MAADIRWTQRLQNLQRAVRLLREPVDRGIATLSDLEKEGTVQRFEVALELAWKSLKDYLEHQGAVITPLTPRNVIKEAFAAKILDDGQVWIDMLDHRNLLSHTYDSATFQKAVQDIGDTYYSKIETVCNWLTTKSLEP